MTQIGNHIKITVPARLRGIAQEFYRDILECHFLGSPLPELDLYEFDGGFVVGLEFVSEGEALSDAEFLRATWLELKVPDPAALTARLRAFGVSEVSYPDPTRFFFQAPGGQVFRVASIDGGL